VNGYENTCQSSSGREHKIDTHVVIHILTTNMEEGRIKADRSKSHRIVRSPQRRSVYVTDTRESTTTSSVGFKHDEWSVVLSCTIRRVPVLLYEFNDSCMRQPPPEVLLRDNDSTAVVEGDSAIIIEVSKVNV